MSLTPFYDPKNKIVKGPSNRENQIEVLIDM